MTTSRNTKNALRNAQVPAPNSSGYSSRLRITLAIAAKDIIDALKGKTTVSVFIGVALLMLSSQAFSLITRLSDVHQVIVYDAAKSQLSSQLNRDRQIRVIRETSQGEMEDALSELPGPTLGLVIPAEFGQTEAAADPELDGYFAHWVKPSDAAQQQTFFEQRLTALVGRTVRINIDGNVVYPGPDSDGQPHMVSLSLTVAIITVSAFLVPYLMIEEKENKTLDALLVSPATIGQVVIGKAIAGMVFGLVAAAVVFAFNRTLVVHWPLALLTTFLAALLAVGIGLLLGSIFDNPQNMSLWTGLLFMILLLPVFLPLAADNLPEILRDALPWMPSAAIGKLFRISFSKSVPLDLVIASMGVVAGCAVLVLATVVSVVRRSDR